MKRLLLSLCVFAIFSCEPLPEKEDLETTTDIIIDDTDDNGEATPLFKISEAIQEVNENRETQQANLRVVVRDVNGDLIEGALVTVGDTSASTQGGLVNFDNITLNVDYAGVRVTKNGYITSVKSVTPSATGNTSIEVTLFAGEVKSFDTTTGQVLTFENDQVSLDFPENALVNTAGDIFEGTAEVHLQYHHPDQDTYAESLPGTLVGLDVAGNYTALATEGMLTVDLTDANGNALQVGEGKSVALKMPAYANSPDSILLWHLNETTGLWEEVGKATKVGNFYEFEVAHFSTYNLDYKIDAIAKIDFLVNDHTGASMSSQKLRVYHNDQVVKTIVTDSQGKFSLLRAPQGTYELRPLLCDGEVGSTTVNISTAGEYTFTVEDFSNLTEGEPLMIRVSIEGCFFADIGLEGTIVELILFEDTSEEIRKEFVFNSSYILWDLGKCISLQEQDGLPMTVRYVDFDYQEQVGITTNSVSGERKSSSSYCDQSLFLAPPIPIDQDLYDFIHLRLGLEQEEVITEAIANRVRSLALIPPVYAYSLVDNVSPKEATTDNIPYYLESIDMNDIASYFINLKSLRVTSVKTINNLDQIAKLSKLQSLRIYDTGLESVVLRQNLTNLTSLHLEGNAITDITSLENLTNLEYLDLEGNIITDVTPLENLTNLEYLKLDGNPIEYYQIMMLRESLPETAIDFRSY